MGVGSDEAWAPCRMKSRTMTVNDHFVNIVSPGTDTPIIIIIVSDVSRPPCGPLADSSRAALVKPSLSFIREPFPWMHDRSVWASVADGWGQVSHECPMDLEETREYDLVCTHKTWCGRTNSSILCNTLNSSSPLPEILSIQKTTRSIRRPKDSGYRCAFSLGSVLPRSAHSSPCRAAGYALKGIPRPSEPARYGFAQGRYGER